MLDIEENTVKIATLIDLNIDTDECNDKSDKIYADFTSNEFGMPHVEQVLWGEYSHKPQAQELFQIQVRKAVDSIVAASEKDSHDFRPRIKDLNTGKYFLINTGACVSVYPKKWCPNAAKI